MTQKSSPFRARDVRANIKELGYEKGLEMSLTLLADEMVGIRQTLTELTKNQEQMIELIAQMTQVSGAMATRISDMKRMEEQFDESRGSGTEQ